MDCDRKFAFVIRYPVTLGGQAQILGRRIFPAKTGRILVGERRLPNAQIL